MYKKFTYGDIRENEGHSRTDTGHCIMDRCAKVRTYRSSVPVPPHGKYFRSLICTPERIVDQDTSRWHDTTDTPWLPFLLDRNTNPAKIIRETGSHLHGHPGDHSHLEPYPRTQAPGTHGKEIIGSGFGVHPGADQQYRDHPYEIRKPVTPGEGHDPRDDTKQNERCKEGMPVPDAVPPGCKYHPPDNNRNGTGNTCECRK
jgi:hypothetical protein